MVINKSKTFNHMIEGLTKLTAFAGSGFPSSAWSVGINDDPALTLVQPTDIELKRYASADSLCGAMLILCCLVTKTNKHAQRAVLNINLNDKQYVVEHEFTDEEKQAEILTVNYEITINLTC